MLYIKPDLAGCWESEGLIIVRFTSGLGNQMFQYNLYRIMKERYPDIPVKADITWFRTEDEHHGFELSRIFGNVPGSDFSIDIASAYEIYSVTGQIPTLFRGGAGRIVRRLCGPINRRLRGRHDKGANAVIWDQLEGPIAYDDLLNLDTGKDHYIFGYFVEEVYYRDRIAKIKKELMFPPLSGENERIAKEMENTQSVSVHIRRGDYLSSKYSDKFLCLDRSYYEAAVNIVREHMSDPVFYMFSEDAEYVKKEFSWILNKKIVNINSGSDSFRDMQLMSKCKANIIANSTFSQWAAILNDNSGHITVYPASYMVGEDTEKRKMQGWIRI